MAMVDGAPAGTHVFDIRIYYEDTDSDGVVYYANYFKFAERARTELLRDLGLPHEVLKARHGMNFVVRRCAAEYRRPARLDDLVEVHSRVLNLRGASMAAEQVVRRDGEILADLTVDLVCLGAGGRPVRMPEALHRALAEFSASPAPILTASQP